jgi:membrane-associated protease RseP (regulator of RpoE activity)
MSTYSEDRTFPLYGDGQRIPEAFIIDVEAEPVAEGPPVAEIVRRRVWLPALLFVGTCLTTLWAGAKWQDNALAYALPVMTILVFHEMGHFLQARRYGVFASFPYFIPVPFGPLGTFGAVIGMDPRRGDRKALFDIGITGPLAGLVPTIVFTVWGLMLSKSVPVEEIARSTGPNIPIGVPLLFEWLMPVLCDPVPPGHVFVFAPMAFAGWVGLLVTSLNLMPIGQLDGGHVLYGLLREKAHVVAQALLLGAAFMIIWHFDLYGAWLPMLILVTLIGAKHPPSANDRVKLGFWRSLLGWLTLAFIPIGFTPRVFIMS